MRLLFSLFLLILTELALAIEVDKQLVGDVEELDYFIYDLYDGKTLVSRDIEGYKYLDQDFLSFDVFLDALGVRYKIVDGGFDVWKGQEVISLNISQNTGNSPLKWFEYEGYYFVSKEVFENLFSATVNTEPRLLKASIDAGDYKFPHLLLAEQVDARLKAQLTQGFGTLGARNEHSVITVQDKYKLFNQPQGYFNVLGRANNTSTSYDAELWLVSDLFYHSANIFVNSTEEETNKRFTLSRYKTSPDDKIWGIWDRYTIGDVVSYRDGNAAQSTEASRGLGVTFQSKTDTKVNTVSMKTNIIEELPPGWDVDVFHNNSYITSVLVPENGLLELFDQDLQYGSNIFKLVIYGPYGETEEIIRKVEMNRNALEKGEVETQLSFQDLDNELLDFKFDSLSLDAMQSQVYYGVTDNWQTGLRLQGSFVNSNNWNYTFNNRLSLANFLLESDIGSNNNGDLFTTTSVLTNFFQNDSLLIQNETSKVNDNSFHYNRLKYDFRLGNVFLNFQLEDQNTVNFKRDSIGFGQRINIAGVSVTNQLSYQKMNDEEEIEGSLTLAGRLSKNINISSRFPYSIGDDSGVDAALVNIGYRFISNDNVQHYFNLRKDVLSDDSDLTLGYNVAWQELTHNFFFSASVTEAGNWTAQAGLRFFFSYDQFNNRVNFAGKNKVNSGRINVHSYLDRHMNGIPDPLDLSLADITFTGNRDWQGTSTNENGRLHLTGLSPGINRVKASWNYLGKPITQHYTVYSHPGGSADLNIPFYLITEIEGSVSISRGENIFPAKRIELLLKNTISGEVHTLLTDVDGVYYSDQVKPGKYSISINPVSLKEQNLETDIAEIEFEAPLLGGFVELPEIYVTRFVGDTPKVPERIIQIPLNDTIELLDEITEEERYIHLPLKYKFNAPFRLDEEPVAAIQDTRSQQIKLDSTTRQSVQKELNENLATYQEKSIGVKRVTIKPVAGEEVLWAAEVSGFDSLREVERFINQHALSSPKVGKSDSFKVAWGKFSNKEELNEYMASLFTNVEFRPVSFKGIIALPKQGWVIQYSARQNRDDFNRELDRLKNVKSIYGASKKVGEKVWFCLISEVYATKSEAELALKKQGVSGFSVPSTVYFDTELVLYSE